MTFIFYITYAIPNVVSMLGLAPRHSFCSIYDDLCSNLYPTLLYSVNLTRLTTRIRFLTGNEELQGPWSAAA